MSKKLYSTLAWRRRMAARSINEIKRRKRKSARGRIKPYNRKCMALIMRQPLVFSLIQNGDEVVTFLNALERNLHNYRVLVAFDDVMTITPEAVLALIATLSKVKSRHVSGSVPTSEKARAILIESGFFMRMYNIGSPYKQQQAALQISAGRQLTVLKRES